MQSIRYMVHATWYNIINKRKMSNWVQTIQTDYTVTLSWFKVAVKKYIYSYICARIFRHDFVCLKSHWSHYCSLSVVYGKFFALGEGPPTLHPIVDFLNIHTIFGHRCASFQDVVIFFYFMCVRMTYTLTVLSVLP